MPAGQKFVSGHGWDTADPGGQKEAVGQSSPTDELAAQKKPALHSGVPEPAEQK